MAAETRGARRRVPVRPAALALACAFVGLQIAVPARTAREPRVRAAATPDAGLGVVIDLFGALEGVGAAAPMLEAASDLVRPAPVRALAKPPSTPRPRAPANGVPVREAPDDEAPALEPREPPEDWNGVAAVNDPGAETTVAGGQSDVRWYQCPKWVGEDAAAVAAPVGELELARLTADSRRNSIGIPDPAVRDASGNPRYEWWRESGQAGVYTCNFVFPGHTYRITVSGTYGYAGSSAARADAECATGTSDGVWLRNRYGEAGEIDDPLDLHVEGYPQNWQPVSPDSVGCSTTRTYSVDWTPLRPGPLWLGIRDASGAEGDNMGQLSIEVRRLR